MNNYVNEVAVCNKESSMEVLLEKIGRHETYTLLRLNKKDPEKYPIATEDILKDLQSFMITALERKVVKVNYTYEDPFIIVNGFKREVEIPLSRKSKLEFDRKHKGEIFYCICTIKYTKEWDILSLHNIEVLNIEKAVEKWQAYISQENFLIDRINRVVEIMGLDPNKLFLREKITFVLARLLPLVEKRYILMDFGPKKRGKTTTYKKFDIHGKSFAITRASVVYNNAKKKYGDIFNTVSDTFLIEEAQNVTDPEFWIFLQTYADGNRGEIVLSSTDVIQATVSLVILGNPNENIDFIKVFADKINIFKNTGIPLKEGEAGGAKLSRIDAMLYSGGCRNISPNMHLAADKEVFPLCIFKQALFELRKEHINIEKLLSILNLPRLDDDRIEISVHKTLEGLIKILMPELCLEENMAKIYESLYVNGIKFLYYLAIELKKIVENTVNILNEQENPAIFPLSSDRVSFLFKDSPVPYCIAPHRIIINDPMSNTIIKRPLDIVGVKQNEDEYKILTLLQNRGINYFPHFEDINLQHSINATFQNVISYLPEVQLRYEVLKKVDKNGNIIAATLTFDGKTPCLFDFNRNVICIDLQNRPLLQNQNGQFFTFEQYGGYKAIYNNSISRLRDSFGNQVHLDNNGRIIMPPILKGSKYWNKGIFYNYLTGEEEILNYGDVVRAFSFYDLEVS